MSRAIKRIIADYSAGEEAEAKKHLKKFDEEPELEIMNGRYGPYIAYKGSNYKIPKDIVPEDLNLDACMEIIKLQSEKAASAPAFSYEKYRCSDASKAYNRGTADRGRRPAVLQPWH